MDNTNTKFILDNFPKVVELVEDFGKKATKGMSGPMKELFDGAHACTAGILAHMVEAAYKTAVEAGMVVKPIKIIKPDNYRD